MSPDEQEARSRRLSNDVIMLLPLQGGNIAVFNRAGELCGIVEPLVWDEENFWENIMKLWHPPATRARPSLEELGL